MDRIASTDRYDNLLQPKGFQTIKKTSGEGTRSVFHLYVVQVSNRDAVQDHLNKAKIANGIHYPVPMSRQLALSELGYTEGQLPISEKAANRLLSLPMFPELTKEQIEDIVSTFLDVAKP